MSGVTKSIRAVGFPVLLILVSLFITPVEAARNKKRKAAGPSATQVTSTGQVDPCELVAPAPVSSLFRASPQLLLPDVIDNELPVTRGDEEKLSVVTSKKPAGSGRKKKEENRKKGKEQQKSSAEMLDDLRKVDVPGCARTMLGKLADTLESKEIFCKKTFINMVQTVVGLDQAEASGSQPSPDSHEREISFPSSRGDGKDISMVRRKRTSKKAGAQVNPEEPAPTRLTTRVFLQKAAVFFSHMRVRTGVSRLSKSDQLNTGSLTTVVRARRKDMTSFIQCSDTYLEEVAELETLKTFTSMSARKGFPEDIVSYRAFQALFGEKEGHISSEYCSSFSSMQHGRGVPTEKRVLDFWGWIKNRQLEDILGSLSSVLSGKGIPDPNDSKPGSPMQALNDFVGLFGEKKGQIPREHFSHFTSMQSSRGVSEPKQILNFWGWIKNRQLEDILGSLSGVLHGKGIPDQNNDKPGSPIRVLSDFIRLFGEEEGQIPHKHFSHFTSMQNGRGVPAKKRVLDFWGWIKIKKLEDILGSLSSVLNGKGIPDPNDNKPGSPVKALNDFVGLFDEDGQISREYFSHFTAMQIGQGVPAPKRVLDFWDWIINNNQEAVLASLSSVLRGKGIPDPNDKRPGSPIQALNDFVGLFREDGGQVPHKHLPHFTSMQNGQGVPAQKRVLDFWGWIKNKKLEGILGALTGALSGKGIPDPDDRKEGSQIRVLKNFTGLFGDKEGQIPRWYLSRFIWMNISRGIPRGQDVKALYSWLGDNSFELLTAMTRLFKRKGFPNLEKLKKHQSQLQKLTGTPATEKAPHLAILALHRTVPGPDSLSEQKMTDYLSLLRQQTGCYDTAAKILARLLGLHQGEGMETYRNLTEKNTGWDPHSIMTLLMEARHLPLARVAIDDIWQGEGNRLADARQFLALARNLKPTPTVTQWREFKEDFLPVLASIILPGKQQSYQSPATVIPEQTLRFYWESLWKMTATCRATLQNEENLRALLKVVRSLAGLHSLARHYDWDAFEERCTCLIDFFQAERYSSSTVQSLVDAHLSLQMPWYESVDRHLLVAEAAGAGSGVHIRLPEQNNHLDKWRSAVGSFVNGLMEPRAQIQQEDHQITLYHNGAAMQVGWPRFSVDETGVTISNWTEEQFDFYCQACEQTEGGESDQYMRGSWLWISNLLQGGGSISSKIWQQLEENRYSLPPFIARVLNNQNRPDIPEPLRSCVQGQARLDQGLAYIQGDEGALSELPPDLQQSLLHELLPGHSVLTDSLLKALESKETLSNNELEDVVTRLDMNLTSGEREKWMGQYYEHQQSRASQRIQPVTMEQWADSIGFFDEDDFTDEDYQPEGLLESLLDEVG